MPGHPLKSLVIAVIVGARWKPSPKLREQRSETDPRSQSEIFFVGKSRTNVLCTSECLQEEMNMALKTLRMICAGGDKVVAEWDPETVAPEHLTEIEREFNKRIAQGWFAAD